jgi:hypothetical protein
MLSQNLEYKSSLLSQIEDLLLVLITKSARKAAPDYFIWSKFTEAYLSLIHLCMSRVVYRIHFT